MLPTSSKWCNAVFLIIFYGGLHTFYSDPRMRSMPNYARHSHHVHRSLWHMSLYFYREIFTTNVELYFCHKTDAAISSLNTKWFRGVHTANILPHVSLPPSSENLADATRICPKLSFTSTLETRDNTKSKYQMALCGYVIKYTCGIETEAQQITWVCTDAFDMQCKMT